MKKYLSWTCIGVTVCIIFLHSGCNNASPAQQTTEPAKKELTHGEQVARGKYLVTTMGCNDCHSPKKMTPQGPVVDSAQTLSGYHAGMPMPPIDKAALKPGNWVLFTPDLSSAVGPWGISYSANITPDSATGIGSWTEDVFIKTLRTGKHLGQDGGRPILPPMPWTNYAQSSDDDLKALFAYLKALPPISNKVPPPVPPTEAAKLK